MDPVEAERAGPQPGARRRAGPPRRKGQRARNPCRSRAVSTTLGPPGSAAQGTRRPLPPRTGASRPQAEQPPPDFDFTPRAEQYDDPRAGQSGRGPMRTLPGCKRTSSAAKQPRRFESRNLGKKWKELDLIEAEVLIVQNEGHYQELKKNGKATAGTMKDQGGTWSIGEYGAMLYNLFVHGNARAGRKSRRRTRRVRHSLRIPHRTQTVRLDASLHQRNLRHRIRRTILGTPRVRQCHKKRDDGHRSARGLPVAHRLRQRRLRHGHG